MTITSILGFISLLGWLMVLAGGGIAISNMGQNKSSRGGVMLALVGLLLGVVFFAASNGVVQVGPTEVAVVFQSIGGNPVNGNLWETPLGPGVHIIVPIINEPILYSTSVRNYTMSRTVDEGQLRRDDAVQARTRDGQQLDMDVSVLYSIDPSLANTVHRRWQNRFETDFVRPTVRSTVREAVASYSVNDLYGGNTSGAEDTGALSKLPELQRALNEQLEPLFKENGLLLQDLILREITFSDEFIRAVEQKQVAEQQAEQAKQEAERARTIAKGQADAQVTAAQGEAKAAEERARGEAAALKLRAEAEAAAIEVRAAADAKALNLINEQISKNPALVQWRYIEKLAPNVSLVLLPSNSPFLFDINQLQQLNGPKTN